MKSNTTNILLHRAKGSECKLSIFQRLTKEGENRECESMLTYRQANTKKRLPATEHSKAMHQDEESILYKDT